MNVGNAEIAGRGGYRVVVDKTSPWHMPRARLATERNGERNGMEWGMNEEVYGCGKEDLAGRGGISSPERKKQALA